MTLDCAQVVALDRFAIEREALQPVVEYGLVLEEPRVADACALVRSYRLHEHVIVARARKAKAAV